ncbi:hypothetical protein EDB92DRAFT_1829874 [Lactarius akahatsu]|uniref:Uncharacterized protein n=1 Tax=Lactarius akahatsu TaxID=416441 RepID=A0AAD4LPF8_9AGAM|nr:hypothetical protein EDB92DRAFT_1829874 [Lactarius akahatsu]
MDRDSHIQPGDRSPHLFPDAFYTAPLDVWATAIQRVPSEAEKCLIEQVVHYKALSDMEHEFLVVHACHPSGSKVVLGVDRNADVLTAAQQHAGPTETAGPSSPLVSSARYLSTLMRFGPSPPSPEAYDSVQVSHDATPAPILAQHGPSVPLSTVSFSRAPRPSLLHLSVLLLTIRTHFPSYALLQYQCYFFARATCLALVDISGGIEVQHEEGQRAATWRGVHVSLYSAGRAALQNMLLLPLAEFPVLIVPAGLFAVYSAVKLYDGNVVESEVDRRRISDEKIREHAIPPKYHAAWQIFVRDSATVRK